MGGTSDRLDLRIKQHLPARILNLELKRGQLANTSGSSIAEHIINSRECVADFNVDRFSILSRSHSIFHLKVLETLYVRYLQPSLCKQKDCLLELNVISLILVGFFFGGGLFCTFIFPPPFSIPLLFSTTFPLLKKISGVNSLIRSRRNRSFTIYFYLFFLTINMPQFP